MLEGIDDIAPNGLGLLGDDRDLYSAPAVLQHCTREFIKNEHLHKRQKNTRHVPIYEIGDENDPVADHGDDALDVQVRAADPDDAGGNVNTAGRCADAQHDAGAHAEDDPGEGGGHKAVCDPLVDREAPELKEHKENRGEHGEYQGIDNVSPLEDEPGNDEKGEVKREGKDTGVYAGQLTEHGGDAVDAGGGKACRIYKIVKPEGRHEGGKERHKDGGGFLLESDPVHNKYLSKWFRPYCSIGAVKCQYSLREKREKTESRRGRRCQNVNFL